MLKNPKKCIKSAFEYEKKKFLRKFKVKSVEKPPENFGFIFLIRFFPLQKSEVEVKYWSEFYELNSKKLSENRKLNRKSLGLPDF